MSSGFQDSSSLKLSSLATCKTYARKHVIAVDKISFEYRICDDKDHTDITEKPPDGCYIYGIYLEGARWDYKKAYINNPFPK
jgi:dynein heavy chain